MPWLATTTARIKVEAADNIFFDLSNVNFTIQFNPESVGDVSTATGLALYANHPNPFNPETAIGFHMPRAGEVSLRVYDIEGRLVRTLVEGEFGAGRHEALWNGKDGTGRAVGSGMYMYELKAMGETLTRSMLLVK